MAKCALLIVLALWCCWALASAAVAAHLAMPWWVSYGDLFAAIAPTILMEKWNG